MLRYSRNFAREIAEYPVEVRPGNRCAGHAIDGGLKRGRLARPGKDSALGVIVRRREEYAALGEPSGPPVAEHAQLREIVLARKDGADIVLGGRIHEQHPLPR